MRKTRGHRWLWVFYKRVCEQGLTRNPEACDVINLTLKASAVHFGTRPNVAHARMQVRVCGVSQNGLNVNIEDCRVAERDSCPRFKSILEKNWY